jgi:hypothetical protein
VATCEAGHVVNRQLYDELMLADAILKEEIAAAAKKGK